MIKHPVSLFLLSSSALNSGVALGQSVSLPTHGNIVAGTVTIGATEGSAIRITQASDRAIINWEAFSIGEGARVDIVQPSATAALLNRVTGAATSQIAGQLNANGRIFLVNPNGIMISRTGSVNAAGFTASTLDVADQDFLAGRDDLTVTARADTPIELARGGYAGLLGGKDYARRLIRARLAATGPADNQRLALDLTGDGFLQVAIPSAGINIAGKITARDVVLRAGTAREAARQTVNLSGTIAATGVNTVGGTVVLTGGEVTLNAATIDVSGRAGGGTVKIGGDRQGGGPVVHTDALSVDAATVIRADAIEQGNGGTITLWSDGTTRYQGTITARGGQGGGDGGSVETSGENLQFSGTIDAGAIKGETGEILLDPRDLTITSTANGTANTPPTNGANPNLGYNSPNATTDSYITPTQLQALTGNVRLQASRDLTVASAVTYAGGSITLEAGRNLTISAALTGLTGMTLTAAAPSSPSFDPTGLLTVSNTLTSNGTIALSAGTGGIVVAGNIAGSAGTLSLTTAGTITQTAGTITTGTLTGSSDGGATFSKANSIANLGAFSDVGNGNLSLTNGRALTLNGTVALGTGTLTFANTGTIAQSSGTITAGTLTGASSSTVTLTLSNAITNLGPFATSANSSFALTDAVPMLSLVGTVSVGTGTLTLTNAGTIVQTGGTVTAGTLAGSSTGGASFGSTNTITNLGAFSDTANGSLSLTNGRALALTGTINLGTGTLALANTGTITQSGGTITAGMLTGSSVGAAAFTKVNTLGALGAFTTASNGNLLLTASVPTLSLTGVVNIGTGTLTLANSGGAITQSAGSITGATLAGSSAGNASFTQANTITNLGAWSTTNNSSLSLTNSVATLNLTGTIGLGTGTLTLNNTGTISQTGGTVTAGTLIGSSVGAAAFTKANVITSLGGFTTASNGNLSLSNARALALNGTVSLGTGTLTFANTGAITQNAGSITAGTLTGTSSGAVTLNQVNAIANVGLFTTSANSNFSLTDAVPTLSLIGNASVGTGTLSLVNAGAIVQTAGIITTGTLTGSSIGGASFTKANALTNIGTFTDTGNGNLSLTDSSTLALTGNIALGSGALILNVGSITQTSGTITAGSLTGASTSTVALTRANAVDALGPFATSANSSFALTDAVPMLSLVGTVSVGTGTLTLTNAGTIVQTGGTVTAGTLAGSSTGGASFGSTNTITNLGAFSDTANGSLSLTNGRALALTGTINLGTGTLALANTGTITQSGGTITAGMLTGSSVGAAAFTKVNTLGALGAFTTASNGNLLLTASVPTLSLTGVVNIGTGTLTLANSGGAITQSAGSITGATLAGSSAGNASFTQANTITNLGAWSTTNNSSLSLTNSVATLNLTGTIGLGTGTLTLNNTGTISQTGGTVTAGTLIGSSVGAAAFTKANVITSLGGFTTASNGNLSLSNARALALNGTVSLGTGTLTFANTGAITQNAGSITAGTLTGTSSGAVTLNQVNAIANVGLFTTSANSNFSLTDAVPTLSLIGNASVGTGTLSLVNAGAIVQTAGIITTGTLTGSSIGGASFTKANAITSVAAFGTGGGDLTLVTNGAMSVRGAVTVGAGNALIRSGTTLTLTNTGSVSGGALTLVAGTNFINNAGGGAFAATDRFLVYSQDPATDIAGGLAFDFRQYAATYGLTTVAQPDGNGFLHSLAPTISVTLQGSVNKVYDGTDAVTLGVTDFSQSGEINGDMVTLSLPATGIYSSTNVGSGINVSATQIAVASASNGGRPVYGYQTASSSVSAAIGNITPATLTYSADGVNRYYGDVNPGLTGNVTGFVAGETQASATTGSATFASTADGTSTPGDYAITGAGLTANNGNYVFVQALGNGSALTLARRPLVVTADAQQRLYGDNNPLTGTATGDNFVNGDFISTVTLATPAIATSNAGLYDLTGSAAAGSGLTNYAITYATRANGLVVTPRPVTVVADAVSRLYGDANPVLTYMTTSLGAGAALSGSLATAAVANNGVGTYAINRGTLTDAANSNYLLTYSGMNLTITARPVTITSDPLSRPYGDPNPVLTFTTTSLGAGGPLSGSLSTVATATSDVGSYAIDRGSVTDRANPNYALSFVDAGLTITERPVTITANAASRPYGDANPALTYATTSLGAGSRLAGALETGANALSAIGLYGISQGSLTDAANPNYALTYVGVDLAVTARPLVITADARSRLYGNDNPLTGTATGDDLVNGDLISSVTLASPATSTSNTGLYDLTASAALGRGLGNYAITYATRADGLVVTRRPVSVTANGMSRRYGDDNPALTYMTTSLGAGAALAGSLATDATATSNVGIYGINRGGLTDAANSNYILSFVGADLTVVKRTISVTADAASRRYGDDNPPLTYSTTSLGAGLPLIGTLTTVATTTSDIGTYTIDQGSLTNNFNPNYDVEYIGGALTIAPRQIEAPPFLASFILRDAPASIGQQIIRPSIGDDAAEDVLVGLSRQAQDKCVPTTLCVAVLSKHYKMKSRRARLEWFAK